MPLGDGELFAGYAILRRVGVRPPMEEESPHSDMYAEDRPVPAEVPRRHPARDRDRRALTTTLR
jgi:hypothetical protein